MRPHRLATLTLFCSVLALPAHGQDAPSSSSPARWYGTLGAGFHLGSHDGHTLGGHALAAAVGHRRFELRVSRSVYGEIGATADAVSPDGLGVLYEAAVLGRLSSDPTRGFYGGPGFGVARSKPIFGLTAGVALPMGRNARFAVEYRWQSALEKERYVPWFGDESVVADPIRQHTFGLGVQFLLGRR